MILILTVFLMFFNTLAFAATDLSALQENEQRFVTDFVDAVNAQNLEGLTALVHSQSIACVNASNQDFFDDFLRQDFKYHFPEDYKASFKANAQDVEQLVAFAKQLGLPYAVAPTHLMQLDYSKKQYSGVTILRGLATEQGKLKLVLPCPSDEAVEKFRAVKVKKEANQLRAKKLYEELKDPLRSELIELIKSGKKIDAYKRYQESTGESLATARDVLIPLIE